MCDEFKCKAIYFYVCVWSSVDWVSDFEIVIIKMGIKNQGVHYIDANLGFLLYIYQ